MTLPKKRQNRGLETGPWAAAYHWGHPPIRAMSKSGGLLAQIRKGMGYDTTTHRSMCLKRHTSSVMYALLSVDPAALVGFSSGKKGIVSTSSKMRRRVLLRDLTNVHFQRRATTPPRAKGHTYSGQKQLFAGSASQQRVCHGSPIR
jgi:hypothetical protein